MQPPEPRDGAAGPEPSQPTGMSRREVRRGGLLGLLVGGGLLGLSGFFLVAPLEEPEQVLGVFLPLAVGLVATGLGLLALLPLALGDAPGTASTMAWALRLLAVVGLVLAALGVLRAEVPWIAGVVAPLLVVVLVLKDAGRLAARAAQTGPGPDPAD